MGIELIVLITGSILLLISGDRIGWLLGCIIKKRCNLKPATQVPMWLIVPISLVIPLGVLLGIFKTTFHPGSRISHEAFANNLELLVFLSCFITGIIGRLYFLANS